MKTKALYDVLENVVKGDGEAVYNDPHGLLWDILRSVYTEDEGTNWVEFSVADEWDPGDGRPAYDAIFHLHVEHEDGKTTVTCNHFEVHFPEEVEYNDVTDGVDVHSLVLKLFE